MKQLLSIIILAVLLVGCKTGWINPSKMSKISIGMTKPEVIKVLGTPHNAEASQSSETLWWLEDQGNWMHIYHFVKLTNGKVDSYGLGNESQKPMQPTAPNSSSQNAPVVVPIFTR